MVKPAVLALLAVVLATTAAAQTSVYPSPNTAWTERQYTDFYFAHYNGRRALPHLREPEPARLFNRLVDPANIAAIAAAHDDAAPRRLALDQVLASIGAIRSSYLYAARVGEPLAEELARVQVFQLELVAAILDAGASPDLTRTHPAWRTAFLGAAASLDENDLYTDEQALILAQAIATHFKEIAPVLLPEDRENLAKRFLKRADSARSAALRTALAQLSGLVRQP
jgi:hypothetical protein